MPPWTKRMIVDKNEQNTKTCQWHPGRHRDIAIKLQLFNVTSWVVDLHGLPRALKEFLGTYDISKIWKFVKFWNTTFFALLSPRYASTQMYLWSFLQGMTASCSQADRHLRSTLLKPWDFHVHVKLMKSTCTNQFTQRKTQTHTKSELTWRNEKTACRAEMRWMHYFFCLWLN